MEQSFVDWLRAQTAPTARAPLGLNDDAALLCGIEPDRCVVTSDLVADGVHFELADAGARRAGRKALAVNLSDLAAMAAEPVAALVSLLLPQSNASTMARDVFAGILPLAQSFDVVVAGGDTNTWTGPLVISITALGQASTRGVLRRSGARPGDAIVVTGPLGGSLLGHHLDFQPRIREALHLHATYGLHAGMDISDGLLLDLHRMATASGCGACLDFDRIPIRQAAHELACCVPDPRAKALQHALRDGEDFELLLAVDPADADRLVADRSHPLQSAVIGRFVQTPGLWRTLPDGSLDPIKPEGYEHGA